MPRKSSRRIANRPAPRSSEKKREPFFQSVQENAHSTGKASDTSSFFPTSRPGVLQAKSNSDSPSFYSTSGTKRSPVRKRQQSNKSGEKTEQPIIQKLGDPTQIPPGMSCQIASTSPTGGGESLNFPLASANLTPAQQSRLNHFVYQWHSSGGNATIRVDGYASVDGPQGLNWNLSCDRANRVRNLLLNPPDGSAGIPSAFIEVYANGETAEFGSLTANRRAMLHTMVPLPPPRPTRPNCGPDVSSWYVRQVNKAMADPAILNIRTLMARADFLARLNGTTAAQVAEGGAATAVIAQLARMSSRPAASPTAVRQIAAGSRSAALSGASLSSSPIQAALILGMIGRAATLWRSLVNHGAKYDFKAHTMKRPSTPDCPDQPCLNSITICPGTLAANCYLTDLPGNLFFAQIGRFVGFSELTLQLGSQLAQLTGSGSFDPPQDTAAIRTGFRLPTPMTAATLCSIVPPARGSLTSVPNCEDCTTPTTAPLK